MSETAPILVEVTRGDRVESRHRGMVAIRDAEGRDVLSIGATGERVFPRSAVKLIQALPLVESGAADAYGFGPRELALACASHGGEKLHVDTAAAMLASAGRDVSALECGVHWPTAEAARRDLLRAGGRPNALHNNCSGKHAGFVCTACHLGIDPAGYVGFDHPVQSMIRDAMEDVLGVPVEASVAATDGCAIPTYALPLAAFATGFARLATGRGLSAERAGAARRLMDACFAEPFMVAGSDRFCTTVMRLLPGRAFVKTGAEGVFCAAFPELGLGVALKCEDGATRASEAMMAAVIAALLPLEGEAAAAIGRLAGAPVATRTGVPVGAVRPSAAFAEGLAAAGPL